MPRIQRLRRDRLQAEDHSIFDLFQLLLRENRFPFSGSTTVSRDWNRFCGYWGNFMGLRAGNALTEDVRKKFLALGDALLHGLAAVDQPKEKRMVEGLRNLRTKVGEMKL